MLSIGGEGAAALCGRNCTMSGNDHIGNCQHSSLLAIVDRRKDLSYIIVSSRLTVERPGTNCNAVLCNRRLLRKTDRKTVAVERVTQHKLTPWATKRSQLSFVCNSVKYLQISMPFFTVRFRKELHVWSMNVHLTWLLLLHYLVKVETPKIYMNTNSAFNVNYEIAVKCTKLHWQFHKMCWWTTQYK